MNRTVLQFALGLIISSCITARADAQATPGELEKELATSSHISMTVESYETKNYPPIQGHEQATCTFNGTISAVYNLGNDLNSYPGLDKKYTVGQKITAEGWCSKNSDSYFPFNPDGFGFTNITKKPDQMELWGRAKWDENGQKLIFTPVYAK